MLITKEYIESRANETLPVTCPKCFHTTYELISKIHETEYCICAECGNSIVITNEGLVTLLCYTNELK